MGKKDLKKIFSKNKFGRTNHLGKKESGKDRAKVLRAEGESSKEVMKKLGELGKAQSEMDRLENKGRPPLRVMNGILKAAEDVMSCVKEQKRKYSGDCSDEYFNCLSEMSTLARTEMREIENEISSSKDKIFLIEKNRSALKKELKKFVRRLERSAKYGKPSSEDYAQFRKEWEDETSGGEVAEWRQGLSPVLCAGRVSGVSAEDLDSHFLIDMSNLMAQIETKLKKIESLSSVTQ